MIEVARYRHAIPAQEKTKQAQEETKRARIASVPCWLVSACVAAAFVVLYLVPAEGWPIAAIIAVLGRSVPIRKVIERAKKPLPMLPPGDQ